ncbi:MAG: hypothetical protein QXW10_00175, partial [Candidatus Micrarchaeaceae archaeon]
TDKPIYACAEANKSDKLRAAVCSNGRDAEEAKEALANVIVLRNSSFQKLNIGDIISTSTGKEIQQLGGSQDSLSPYHRNTQKQHRGQQKRQNKESDDYENMEEEEPMQSSSNEKGKGRGKGIFGKLKNTLGIEE